MKTILGFLVLLLVATSVQAQAPLRRNYYTTNAAPAGSANWVDVSTNSYTLGNVGLGTVPITAQRLTLEVDNLTTSPINGLFLTNGTAATVGVQVQDSPAIYQSGNAWLTGSASNAPVVFRSYVVPVAGATAPTSLWKLDSSLNNGAFANVLNITGSGNVDVLGNITALNGNMTIKGNGAYVFLGAGSLYLGATSTIQAINTSFNGIINVQANIPQVTKTANYTIAVLDSGLRFVNIGAVATNRLDLPTAAAGMHFWVYIDAAQNCRLQATGSDVVRDAATVSGAGGGIESLTVGSTLHVFSPKALLWVVDQKSGTWVGPNGP